MTRMLALTKYFTQVTGRHPELGLPSMLGAASKLGPPQTVRTFNLPMEETCCGDPTVVSAGASPVCRACCYAWKMREGRPSVVIRAQKNWQIVQRGDFPLLLMATVLQTGVPCIRLHDVGDFWSVSYIEQIARIVRACRPTFFWAYTRIWRRPQCVAALTTLAAEPNMSVLLSADRLTGLPPAIPDTRVAWLADTDADGPPARVHVVFRATREKTRDGYIPALAQLGGSPVCTTDSGQYSPTDTYTDAYGRVRRRKVGPESCVQCGHCLFKRRGLRDVPEDAGQARRQAV